MSKLKKIFYIVTSLILMTVLLINIFQFWFVTNYTLNFPSYIINTYRDILNNKFIVFLFERYQFWVSLVILAILLVFMIVVMFYPKTYTEFKIDKNNHLLIKKTALESYIRTSIDVKKYMKNPTVNTRVFKRKVIVFISGEIVEGYSISLISKELKKDIENGFSEFIGLNKCINLKVSIKDVSSVPQNKEPRVK